MPSPDSLLADIFRAYYDARRNKRSTINALRFEVDFESKLIQLCADIRSGTYRISPSICFIIFRPVKREIFAGDFRDRIVHHLIFNYLNPLFERLFINDSYSCRKGRGTSYGIARVDHFIRSCSENYTRDCYILKLDIQGYFMSIDRTILYQKVETVLNRYRSRATFDPELVLRLIRQVVYHDPTKHCITKGKKSDWRGLPKTKSLFFSQPNRGLPIGNLTSQLFGNVYLNALDHFITHTLGCRYYGRYVDDFVIVHRDKAFLQSLIPRIIGQLRRDVALTLHPKKIYLQYYAKGITFLGVIIKPYRQYVCNRIKGNCYHTLREWHRRFVRRGIFTDSEWVQFITALNSYFGITRHYATYNLRRKFGQRLLKLFRSHVLVSDSFRKAALTRTIRVENT